MYGLMRRRSMMTMAIPVPTERLIYSLTDYTCDGTVNTFIDTEIKLFGYEYDSFRIEMEYDHLVPTSQATLLECRSFVGSPSNGLTAKVRSTPQSLDVCIRPSIPDVFFDNALSATLSIVYSKQACSITVNGQTENGIGFGYHNEPLTIGGRYSSHLSNPDLFVQVHISSLKIYATPSGYDPTYINLPLTFKCLTGGDLSIKNANTSWDRNFEYSLNGGAWTAFDLPKNTASKLIATLSPNDTISFRRDNDNFADAQFISDSNLTFDIYGNLLSLQYGSAFNGQTGLRNTGKQAFGAIFSGTNVVDASKLMLTAPTLSGDCYSGMFKHCTSLVSAPIVFATTLNAGSLNTMFSECYNLINVQPALYFTTLSKNCCLKMFNDCQSLVNAPILPATTLAESCYNTMFRNCYSLTDAPELPATTMAKSCYTGMFSGCTGLVSAPELPATTLTESCYQSMFESCSSLTTAPSLPATTLAKACYASMFRNCTGLTTAPSLPATTLAESCYYDMFNGCTSLTTAPELSATILTKNCYRAMFSGCTSITAAPELRAQTLVETCYNTMFSGCSSLNYIKCLATDISASNCIYGWVSNVNANGTFIKASGVTWPSGAHGIPNNWTIIEE